MTHTIISALTGFLLFFSSVAMARPEDTPDITPLIGTINLDAGSASFQLRCIKCHHFDKDASPLEKKRGPNLWGIYNNNIASVPDYEYSNALKSKSSQLWTYVELNQYIYNPGDYAPGTKHPFIGLPDSQERANIIGWLSTLYDPEALAKKQAAAAAAESQAPPAPAPVAPPPQPARR